MEKLASVILMESGRLVAGWNEPHAARLIPDRGRVSPTPCRGLPRSNEVPREVSPSRTHELASKGVGEVSEVLNTPSDSTSFGFRIQKGKC